ncbi:MAG TPA: hypothetical protein VFF67_09650 [Thermoplasmata archaeon]|nr:hypothetical protein [Thermoplasmata archaeon]
MRRWLLGDGNGRAAHEPTEVVRPLEVPVVTETKRLMGLGQVEEAVRYAYTHAVADARRALDWDAPAHATHREVILSKAAAQPPNFATHLARLYALYEPIRYGERVSKLREDPVDLLRSLYSYTPMWRLYALPPDAPGPRPAGVLPGPVAAPADPAEG